MGFVGRVTRALLLLMTAGGAVGARGQSYDLIVRNGRIVDGTGSPWYAGDIAVRDGRIVAIAPPKGLGGATAKVTIDAKGMVVAPGFIDMLGQSERNILAEPHVPSKLFQGITTEITGEGASIAPRNEAMMTEDRAGVPADVPYPEFATLGEYFRRLEAQGIGINLASYVGAATVRRMVLGHEDRAPTAAELAQMQELVRQAMRDGAMGLSSSLMYAPGVYAKTPELVALAKAAGESGGMYATHLRSEADGLFPALDEAFTIGREAGIPVEIFHLKVAGPKNWGEMAEVVRRIDAAREQGLDVGADTYAYPVSGNPGSAMVPPWAHVGGDAAMVTRLRDPSTRAKIRESMARDRAKDNDWDNEWFMVKGPEGVWISGTTSPVLKPLIGETLAEVAAARGVDAMECMMDLLAEDPRMSVLLATMSEGDVVEALKQPWVSVGLDAGGTTPTDSAAGRHPRTFGTFPHILRKYVREDRLLTLPEAIRKFTALPAARMHLADRGVLKAGMWADIVIFNPAKVRDNATFERPNQLAEGMAWVLVNGVPVIAEGKATGALPGRVLKGPGSRE